MDCDLFETDDDFLWLISPIYTDKTENTDITNPYPMLNCSPNNISESSRFSEDSFVSNFFIFKDKCQNLTSTVELTNYGFSKGVLSIREMFQNIIQHSRMCIQILVTSLKKPLECDGQSYFEQRKQITLMYHTLLLHINLVSTNVYQKLLNIRKLLNFVVNKEVSSSICVFTATQNKSKDAAYHLLHGFLEWRFIDLMISKERQNLLLLNETSDDPKEFLQLYEAYMDDLFTISFCWFRKIWLLLQFLSEKYNKELDFWKSFTACVGKNRERFDKDISKQDLLLFKIWLTKGVLMLEGYEKSGIFEGPTCSRISKNFELVEKMTEFFLKAEPSDEQTGILLVTLMPLIFEWHSPKADIPMMLWEYFYRKINSSLYVTSFSSTSLPIHSLTGRDYLERIKSLLVSDSMLKNY